MKQKVISKNRFIMTGCEIIQAMANIAKIHSKRPLNRRTFVTDVAQHFAVNLYSFGTTIDIHCRLKPPEPAPIVFNIKNYHYLSEKFEKKLTARETAEKNKTKFYDHYYKKRKH